VFHLLPIGPSIHHSIDRYFQQRTTKLTLVHRFLTRRFSLSPPFRYRNAELVIATQSEKFRAWSQYLSRLLRFKEREKSHRCSDWSNFSQLIFFSESRDFLTGGLVCGFWSTFRLFLYLKIGFRVHVRTF
jgi:hypothetical protein